MAFLTTTYKPRLAYKRSASPLTTGTLFTFTGGIKIRSLIGIVRTTVQTQATTVGIGVTVDALTAMPLCAATLDLNAAVIGSLIVMPAAVASAAVKLANGAGLALQLDNTPFNAICTTSGVITVTYGAASTGVVDWYLSWEPITTGFGLPSVS